MLTLCKGPPFTQRRLDSFAVKQPFLCQIPVEELLADLSFVCQRHVVGEGVRSTFRTAIDDTGGEEARESLAS